MANQEENTIIEEREALMVPSNGNVEAPILKNKAHFLKPTLNPTIELLPKHPFSSLPSKPKIRVYFRGKPIPQNKWQLWVGNLQQTHESTWKKAGIFDAIRASTYNLMKDNMLIMGLAEYWCDETKSFVFPWGECTITLEDVMILGGFSVLGENVHAPFDSNEVEEIGMKLMSAFPEKRKNTYGGRIEQRAWVDHFMDVGGELEHIALIVLWLSRYVFPKNYYCQISPDVVPIAICLARGTRIGLAPAVLASLYYDLRLLKQEMVDFVNESSGVGGSNDNLVLWSPMQLVQLWGWERFPTLAPNPIVPFRGEPRLARWQNLSPVRSKVVVMNFVILEEIFVWRPYALWIENWELPQFYSDEERLVLMSSEVGEGFFSFARCLKPCELVGLDCIEQYLPHRVGMQFGLDQDIPCSIPRLNDSVELAWTTYDASLDGVKLYLAPRLLQGGQTIRYFTWSRTVFCFGTCSDSGFEQHSKQRRISRRSREDMQSQDLDAILIDKREFDLAFVPCNLFNVPVASCSVHHVGEEFIEATTSNLGDNQVDNSEWLPSQSLGSAHDNFTQNVDGNVQHSYKETLPCFSSLETVAAGSGLVQVMLSHEICDVNEEMPSLSLENDIEKADMGAGLKNADDEQGKAAKCTNVKPGNGTLDEKVVIIDDNDERKKAQNYFDPVEALHSKVLKFDARISKLEKVVFKMQEAKLKSKVKKEI